MDFISFYKKHLNYQTVTQYSEFTILEMDPLSVGLRRNLTHYSSFTNHTNFTIYKGSEGTEASQAHFEGTCY